MKYVDLTQTFTAKTLPYPGDPAPELRQIARIAREGFSDHRVTTGMHVGTHVDAPAHMIDGGKKICDISVDRFFGPAHVLDARNLHTLDADLLIPHDIRPGDMVFIMTGFEAMYGSEAYFQNFPEVSEALANVLAGLGIHVLGLDTPSPDKAPYVSHKILLGKEILIVENMANLQHVFGKRISAVVLPWKLESDAAPCRVVAELLE